MNIDEFIERAQESAKKHRYHADFFDINNPMRAVCIKSAEDCEQLAEWLEKSKEYQHLEEQDRLVKLPCKDVYFVIDINNPKYAMVMKRPIRELAIYEIEDIDKENRKYFSTKEKAEAKLRESRDSMTEKNNKEPSPCSGCKYEKSTNIKELLAFCTHCKRDYSHEEDREIHEDRYEVEESEG